MAVKITSLENIAKQFETKTHIYQDLTLDFKVTDIETPAFQQNIAGSDVAVDYDINAVRNSLRNLFNTKPGQRFLFPLYGLDLNQFLFEPITPVNSQAIGETIYDGIVLFEPRVDVRKINVRSDPDNNLYNIDIIFSIPSLNITETYTTALDLKSQSFIYVPTSRNT